MHFSSDLSYDDVAGPNQHPSRTSSTLSCQRGTSGLSCCCCCCSQTWGPPQIWKLCQTGIVEYPSDKVVSGSLCIWLTTLSFFVFLKGGQCFPCLLSKLQDFRKCIEVDKKNSSENRDLLLLSPSGDLGVGLVWDNLSVDPTHFLVRLLKSSSNWTKLSMMGPRLFSGWYQMIFRLGSDWV